MAKAAQLMLIKPRGGKRRGAGRPAKGVRASSPHKARPKLAARHPVHVVMRVALEVGTLRRQVAFRAIRAATISAAKHLNAATGHRRGCVFTDRYYAVMITSPRQARHVLSYVMNNWRHHREDREPKMGTWKIDWCSSAIAFQGWAEYGDVPLLWRGPAGYEPLAVIRAGRRRARRA